MEEYVKKSEVNKMIQDGINQYMVIKQFTVSKIPAHEHDGGSNTKVKTSNLDGFFSYQGTAGGVVNPTVVGIDSAIVQGNVVSVSGSEYNRKGYFACPIPVIYGNSGVNTFQGGEAETGLAIVFTTFDDANPHLFIRVDRTVHGISDKWFGVPLTEVAP